MNKALENIRECLETTLTRSYHLYFKDRDQHSLKQKRKRYIVGIKLKRRMRKKPNHRKTNKMLISLSVSISFILPS